MKLDDETLSRQAAALSADPAQNRAATNSRDYFVAQTELLRLFGLCRSETARRQIAAQMAQLDRLHRLLQEQTR